MPQFVRASVAGAALVAVSGAFLGPAIADNQAPPTIQPGTPAQQTIGQTPEASDKINRIMSPSANFLEVPQVRIIPGDVKLALPKSPVANDPQAAARGMRYFNSFNCVGCHAPNGGGGMGLALSNSSFKFGSEPANIFLVISHGAPLGMPAWGSVLPDNVIWDIVAYIQSISKDPSGTWGKTVNAAERMPAIEQVPAQLNATSSPWDHTQPFSRGRKPSGPNPTVAIPPEPNSGPR